MIRFRTASRQATMLLAIALAASGCASVPQSSPVPSLGAGAGERARGGGDIDLAALYAQAGRAYDESRWIEAARDYGKLTVAVPDDGQLWFRLANTYARQGDYGRAEDAYEASLLRDREQPKPWFNLSTVYLLNAQAALREAHAQMRADDPGRTLIERRLTALEFLIHGRFEDEATPAVAR